MEITTTTPRAWPEIVERLADEPTTGSRIGGTRERMAVTVRSPDPRERWLIRDGSFNMAFALQESLAYWCGLNPGHVERYNTQMEEWMVDGELPGSAYGDRMRNTAGHDQIERAMAQIRENPETRRAVIQVHQAGVEDYDGGDVSCTAHLQLLERDGALHMHAVLRSQDMYWGYPYDTQNNQMLQEWMAGRLGLELGEYWHTMTSCHYYTDFEPDVMGAVDEHSVGRTGDVRLGPERHDAAVSTLRSGLKRVRSGGVPHFEIDSLASGTEARARYADWLRVMAAYEMSRFHDDPAAASELADAVSEEPWAGWIGSYVD